MLVGDISSEAPKPQSSSSRRDAGMSPSPAVTPEMNFGYLPAAGAGQAAPDRALSASSDCSPSQKPLLQRFGVKRP